MSCPTARCLAINGTPTSCTQSSCNLDMVHLGMVRKLIVVLLGNHNSIYIVHWYSLSYIITCLFTLIMNREHVVHDKQPLMNTCESYFHHNFNILIFHIILLFNQFIQILLYITIYGCLTWFYIIYDHFRSLGITFYIYLLNLNKWTLFLFYDCLNLYDLKALNYKVSDQVNVKVTISKY